MFRIECTLHGSLEDSLPSACRDNCISLNFDLRPNVIDVFARLDIDPENVQFALADGYYIEFDCWEKPIECQNLQLWPRITGG